MNKEEKVNLVVTTFLENPTLTINEISELTDISSSSVQRYLNINEVKAIVIPKLGVTIEEQLRNNMIAGRSKGGRTTFIRYDAIKDESGRYTGLIATENDNKEEIKRDDIRRIIAVFSANPLLTLAELTNEFNGEYTKDYVYRCLTDVRVQEIFSKETQDAVLDQLDKNRYGILRKFQDTYGTDIFEQAGITPREREIIEYRFGQDKIVSASVTANFFGISKSAVTALEERALEKIEEYRETKQK